MKRTLLPLLVLLAIAPGCSASDDAEVKASCDDHSKTDGVCPGVTSAAATTSVACSAKIEASTQAELDSKLGSATAGTCVVLAASTFGLVKLPAGVHLLGKGASATKVDGVTVTGAAGSSSTISGIQVGKGGIVASGGGALTIDSVHVTGAAGAGISATDTSLSVTTSTVASNGGFGIEANCKTSCTPRLTLAIRRVMVRNNRSMGILAQNVDVSIDGAQVEGTQPVDFQYGRGLEIAWGGTLKANHLAVVNNVDVGIFVQEGSADLDNFVSSGNQRGVQLQAVTSGTLQNFEILNNTALGIGITNGSLGIIVQGGRVASTKMLDVPVDIGGIQGVGDGINWLDGSDVKIASTVRIESSARRGVIISASSKGSFDGVLAGGDETQGIIVQGGLEASMPTALNIASGVKSEVLTKDRAMPVAVAVSAAMKKTP
jgi:hypothetical protein